MTKRLVLVLFALALPFALGLLFTYDLVKLEWISFMEIQPAYRSQRDPLPLPANSVPVQGAAYVAGLGAPVNPVPADEVSLARGKQLYDLHCALCHGAEGNGKGPFAVYLTPRRPANLLQGNAKNNSDGAIFMVISNGVAGTMPPLKENLPTPRQRWDVVNYLRALQKQAQP